MPHALTRRRKSGTDRPAKTDRPAQADEQFAYDAFISYSREADRALARALQDGLHAFARPWYRLRALRVFRDEGSLAVGSRLWGSIQQALGTSRYFILLACERSARAPWVVQEVEYWCTQRGVDNLVIVLTDPLADGTGKPPGMVWDELRGDFDWERTTAIPKCLSGRFEEEPHALVLGWARARPELSPRDPEFRTALASLASPLHGVDKDKLIGDDVRQHRRTRRHVRLVITMLTALATIAGFAAVTAFQERDIAREQAALAEVRQYAAQSRSADDPYAALAFAIAAELRVSPALPEARTAFGEAVQGLESWTTRLVGEVPVTSSWGTQLRWSSDGSNVWVASAESGMARWSVRDGIGAVPLWRPTDSFGGDGSPYDLQWSQDGRFLMQMLGGTSGNSYVIRDAVSGRVTAGPFTFGAGVADGVSLRNSRLAPGGDLLATAASDDGVRLWDAGTGRRRGKPLPGSTSAEIFELAWSPDGGRLAAAGTSRIWIWDVDRRSLIWSGQRKEGAESLSWSPDGRRIVTGDEKGRLTWWNARTGEASATAADGWENRAREISWSPNGEWMAVAHFDGTIRLWDPASGTAVGSALARDSKNSLDGSLVWSPDSRFLAGVFIKGGDVDDIEGPRTTVLRLWEVRTTTQRSMRLRGPTDSVLAVAWSPDGHRIASGGSDDTVWIWDAETGVPVPGSPQRQRFSDDRVHDIAWDPSGRRLLRVSGTGLRTWSVTTGTDALKPWWGSGWSVTAAWSPDGTRVASGTDQGRVRVWDAATGKLVRQQPRSTSKGGGAGAGDGLKAEVRSVAWSGDGRRLAAAMADGSLHLWDAVSGQQWGPAPQASEHLARDMAWSPDGRLIAVADVDGTIRFWDGDTGKAARILLDAGDSRVESLAWSPDSTRLASGDGAGTIRVWDPRRGVSLQRREDAHSVGVTTLSWSPDGTRLVSGSEDGVVRLWQGRTEQEICRLVDKALHRTRSTPELTGTTDAVAGICSRPDQARTYPVLPLQPR
ncbi:TIR domain-containing protein [Streptomyces sp. NBC_00878]|uniref:toll/interleukin-1 receptor domain-containing protein n=1 Tax=Streptomyces sp. NBC_00878 TaxID=2975854 RepID=UPI0022519CF2|nr:TIR domain-containing protein [Streptomyces sp. NBC_00878]MCX4905725.1 TIR domain-containing protein [Streptomyces sp. NBC_00878]